MMIKRMERTEKSVGEHMYRVLELNPQLQPFAGDIDLRMHLYRETKKRLVGENGSLKDFANAHEYFGIHRTETGWVYRDCIRIYFTNGFSCQLQISDGLYICIQ